jgi:glycosyltransferase involved in cell wall biosynthesis
LSVRLLFLGNNGPTFFTHRLVLARAAKSRGWDVHAAIPYQEAWTDRIRVAGIAAHDIPLKRGGRDLLGEWRLLAACSDLIRRIKPDIVHCITLKPILYGGIAARLAKVPAVVHAMTGLGHLFLNDDWRTRLQRRAALAGYAFALGHPNARAIFQNEQDRAAFVEQRLVALDQVAMIPGVGVDLGAFAPSPEPPEPLVVGFPARIIGDKGIHEFIGAARKLRAEGVGARFVLIGRTDPDNPTEIAEATIRAWEAEGIVEWRGFSFDMPTAYARCHIVCMPSYMEGWPKVLVEAAACARPVVTTDVPGCRDVVRDGETGFLVPPRDVEATAAAIRRLIVDAGLRGRMGREARACAEREFSADRFIADSLAIYDDLLARRRGNA